MIFKVSKKFRGELVIPTVGIPLVAGASITVEEEDCKNSDIQMCVKKGYLVPGEPDKKILQQYEKTNKKEIKVRNISKKVLNLYDKVLNPNEIMYIDGDTLNDSYIQKAIFLKMLCVEIDGKKEEIEEKEKVVKKETRGRKKKELKNVKFDEKEYEENDEKEDIQEELKNMDPTTSSTWDPDTKTMLNKKESHEKLFGNELEELTIDKPKKRRRIKKKKTNNIVETVKKTRKRRKTTKVGAKRTPPVEGVYSPDDDLADEGGDLALELDSQGHPLDKDKSEIAFVDEEQEKERIQSRPDIPNNLEI